MLISGVQPLTLVDFHDTPSCIIFTAGCNFRCGFCHNPEFVLPEELQRMKPNFIPDEAVFNFLHQRIGLLRGVVISGGEPTLQADLIPFIARVKQLGFKVKLDTNGALPQVLNRIIEKHLVDAVAMDIKTAPSRYAEMVGRAVKPATIETSVKLITTSGIPHEFRTTLIRRFHTPHILREMADAIHGAQRYTLQTFRPGHTLDPDFAHEQPFSREEMERMAHTIFKPHVSDVRVI